MAKSDHLKFPKGADFATSSLRSLFSKLENDGEFANLIQISTVGASEEDLRKVLNNPTGSILDMTPDQIRAELASFEEHHPGELVPLKKLIRDKLRYWEVRCNREQEVPTATFLEGEPVRTVIHDLQREVGRGVKDIFSVEEARWITWVITRNFQLPGEKPVQVVTSQFARLEMLVGVRNPGWMNALQAHGGARIFRAHSAVANTAEKPLLGIPLTGEGANSAFTDLSPDQLVLVHEPPLEGLGYPGWHAQIGLSPHLVQMPMSQGRDLKGPRELCEGAFPKLDSGMRRAGEGFRVNWREVVPVERRNVQRIFGNDKTALAIAAHAYVGLTGEDVRAKNFIVMPALGD